jgi:hypothetical protein
MPPPDSIVSEDAGIEPRAVAHWLPNTLTTLRYYLQLRQHIHILNCVLYFLPANHILLSNMIKLL